MRTHSLLSSLATVVAAVFLVGCGGFPNEPDPPITSRIVAIEISGQDAMNVGQRVQFLANIRLADGTTKSVGSMAGLVWRSSDASVASVTSGGWVTALAPGYGQTAAITAEVTPPAKSTEVVQATRTVAIRSKSAVAGELEISKHEEPEVFWYEVALKFAESAGIGAAITSVSISFDNGWGGGCSFSADNLGRPRLEANGTLALNPIVCGWYEAFVVDVTVGLKDDNGYESNVRLRRELSTPARAR